MPHEAEAPPRSSRGCNGTVRGGRRARRNSARLAAPHAVPPGTLDRGVPTRGTWRLRRYYLLCTGTSGFLTRIGQCPRTRLRRQHWLGAATAPSEASAALE